jgi:DNA-binding NtrC family response regulator
MSDTKIKSLVPTRTLTREGMEARRMRAYRLVIEEPARPPRTEEVAAPLVRVGSRNGNDVVLADEAVSRLHFEIGIDENGYRLVDLESTNGTFVDDLRARDVYLRPGSRIKSGSTILRFEPLELETDVPALAASRFGPLVGGSVAMREVFAILEKAARSDATVLVEGETGTGKELVARAVHDMSPRHEGPFVVFDCASVPANLLESELFGHEKGAFTGAISRRIGQLEEADGGTLFIDELGELPIELQPKLLRALEQREVRRVGGTTTIPVDIRIVAATNRELAKEVNRGAFREDLYYRLAVVRVALPPLRKRRDDVRALVASFIEDALRHDPARAKRTLASISEANWQRLESHPWPGNVRQLRNVIERTLALSGGDEVRSIDPPTVPRMAAAAPTPAPEAAPSPTERTPFVDLDRPFVDSKAEVLAFFEKNYLEGQLARHDGNFSRAAAAAGIDRMYFKRLLKKYR